MPDRLTSRERLVRKIKAVLIGLILTHPDGAPAKERGDALWRVASEHLDEAAWKDFLSACIEAAGKWLADKDRPSVSTEAGEVLCDWCFIKCLRSRRPPGCPMCYTARREFEASKAGTGGGL